MYDLYRDYENQAIKIKNKKITVPYLSIGL
jgi:hypothetical protein